MAVSLSKGGNVSLTKEAPGLTEVIVGLGWDPRVTDGTEFDLDASVFIVGESGKVLNDGSFVFYNNKTSPDGNVVHQGDNRSGAGEGDDEQINVNLAGLAQEAKKLAFAVTIHDADGRKQNFGQVSNAYIRVLNKADNKELFELCKTLDFNQLIDESNLTWIHISYKVPNRKQILKL